MNCESEIVDKNINISPALSLNEYLEIGFEQRPVNWNLWSQNIDISPAMSLNDYLVVDIGFEQRPVNWNLLNQNWLRYFSIHLK